MDLQITGLKVDAKGEGSRGGVVIGRTTSGKPIYNSHRHSGHKDFTDRDHDDARRILRELGGDQNKKQASKHRRSMQIIQSKRAAAGTKESRRVTTSENVGKRKFK